MESRSRQAGGEDDIRYQRNLQMELEHVQSQLKLSQKVQKKQVSSLPVLLAGKLAHACMHEHHITFGGKMSSLACLLYSTCTKSY